MGELLHVHAEWQALMFFATSYQQLFRLLPPVRLQVQRRGEVHAAKPGRQCRGPNVFSRA